jgi:hypothetical protein
VPDLAPENIGGAGLSRQHRYRIGGMKFEINPPPGTDLFLSDPAYREFVKETKIEQDETDKITVDLLFGRVPEIRGMESLFKAENAWSLFRDKGDYVLIFEAPREDFQKLVRFSLQSWNVALFCDESGNGATVRNPLHYPLDQVLLMYFLSMRNGAIVHSAGVVRNGRGCLFAGRSGAGKSTISRKLLWMTGSSGLSDDRIIVRKAGDSFNIFGTPWHGDAGIAVNGSAPLSQIFFLVQSEENRIEQITEADAFRRFMPVLSIPWYDKEAVSRIFSFVEELIAKIPSYVLYFTPDIEADLLEEFVSRQ